MLSHAGPCRRAGAQRTRLCTRFAPASRSARRAGSRNVNPRAQGPRETFEGLRIGIQRRCLLNGSHPDQESAFAAALDLAAQAGAHIIDIDIPDIEAANPIASLLIMVEAAALHRSLMESHEAGYLPETLARLATGFGYTAVDYRAALACRTHLLRQTMRHAFDRVDLLMTPTTPRPAPRIDGADLPDGGLRLVWRTNRGPAPVQCHRIARGRGAVRLSAAGLPPRCNWWRAPTTICACWDSRSTSRTCAALSAAPA